MRSVCDGLAVEFLDGLHDLAQGRRQLIQLGALEGADDLCPICGYSLTLRAGTQKCAWQHKRAQAEAKKDGLS